MIQVILIRRRRITARQPSDHGDDEPKHRSHPEAQQDVEPEFVRADHVNVNAP